MTINKSYIQRCRILTNTLFRTVHKISNEKVNSSGCNEAEQMTLSGTMKQSNASPSVHILNVSNASTYEDVVLRPKAGRRQHQQQRFSHPFSVLYGLFKSHRECSGNQGENNETLPKSLPHDNEDMNNVARKKSKRKSWNFFKSKKKHRDESPTFQHFQEPLNVERFSLSNGLIDNNVEWYDLNKEEMSSFELHISDIINEFNNFNYNQTFGESDSDIDVMQIKFI